MSSRAMGSSLSKSKDCICGRVGSMLVSWARDVRGGLEVRRFSEGDFCLPKFEGGENEAWSSDFGCETGGKERWESGWLYASQWVCVSASWPRGRLRYNSVHGMKAGLTLHGQP